MKVVAGVDEAGYGPLLGPLVVSCAAFAVEPDEGSDGEGGDGGGAAPPNLWARLGGAVRRTPPAAGPGRRAPRDDGRLVVCDSKKLYQQGKGLRAMEEAVLAFRELAAPGPAPPTLHAFLDGLGIPRAALDVYPWFRGRDLDLPYYSFKSLVAKRRAMLERACGRAGLRPLGLRIVPVHPREFNAAVTSEGNKHRLELGIVASFLGALFRDHGEAGVDVSCDKLSGRDFYGDLLERAAPGARVEPLEEGNDRSVYRVTEGPRRLVARFLVGGEDRCLPTALASLASKYVRELFMHCLNAFFVERLPRLRPTAGYYGDARRFLDEVRAELARLAVDEALLVRRC